MCEMYTWRIEKCFIRDNPISSSERMLHKGYYRKSSVEKNNSGRGSQEAWRQDELICVKRPVVK
jgi:stalled ribosome alternative rescue factor ArfA